MSIIKIIIILFLITAHTQQTDVSDVENKSQQKKGQVEFGTPFFFEHQCSIQQVESQGISALLTSIIAALYWTFQLFLIVLPWIYLIYSIVCAVIMVRYYHNDWFCLSYTITNLVKQIHNGALYMIYCQVTQGYEMLGKIFFYIIMIPNLLQIARIAFFDKLNQTQKRILAAYFSILILMILSFREYYNITTQVVCYTTHILQLSYNTLNKTSNKFNSIILNANLTINTIVFFFVPVYSKSYFLESNPNQKMFYAAYSATLIMISTFLVHPHLRKQMSKGIIRLYYVLILKRLGHKLQTDACSICWQEMDIFLGVDDIKDIYKVHGNGLIRVHRNHIFHRVCILKWSLVKDTCPLDNEQIDL